MKKAITICGFFVVVIIVGILVLNIPAKEETYNEHPDLASKVVGSKSYAADKIPVESVDDLVKGADYVIVGEVVGDPIEESFNMVGDEEMAQVMLEKGKNPYIPATISDVHVLEVLYGDLQPDSVIELFELGKPSVADWQTKVEKGEKLVMILRDSGTAGRYYANNAEDSMFYLNEKNKVTSMSDEMICARYDGLSKKKLESDLLAALSQE